MPFKSQAQRRKFAELLVKGDISNETFEEWNRETGRKKLPERVTPARRRAGRSAPKRKTAGTKKKRKVRSAPRASSATARRR
jgi:hypothetical protein